MARQSEEVGGPRIARWPVFVDAEPMEAPWRPGVPVEVSLVWLEDPGLPDDLVLHDVVMDRTALPRSDGRGELSLLRRGGLTAASRAQLPTGRVSVSGLPYWDRYAHVTLPDFPVTAGVVRRIAAVHRLHARRADRWELLGEPARVRGVPDTSASRLGVDPPRLVRRESTSEPMDSPPRFLSTAEYLREFGHLLPEREWQPAGFLVQLQVANR